MTDPTINVDHPLYWQRKCDELQARLRDEQDSHTQTHVELAELQARLEAGQKSYVIRAIC